MFTFLSGSFLTLTHLLMLVFCASSWAHRIFKNRPLAMQWTACSIGTWWLSGMLFAALIIIGVYNRTSITLILLLLSAITALKYNSLTEIRCFWQSSIKSLVTVWTNLPPWIRITTIAVATTFVIRFARGIIAPPLAWDALTYHLLKAGRWVQLGRWVTDNAPDCWQFYEWFPPLGDSFFAWAMLGSHTDAWLPWLGALIWLNCAFGTYSLARALDFDQNKSWIAATTIAATPACLAFITANYVDNPALALVTMGSAMLISGTRTGDLRQLTLSMVSMGLAVGVKITFLPYLLVSVAIFIWYSATKRLVISFALGILSLIPCLTWQIWLIFAGKTPFFPAPFSILGIQIEQGKAEFLKHHYSPIDLEYAVELPISFLKFLKHSPPFSPGHYNFTWTFPLVLLLGSLGSYQAIKVLPLKLKVAYLGVFISGLAIFISFWVPQTGYYRAVWVENLARFFTSWYAILVIAILYILNRHWQYLFGFLIAIHIYEAWPKAWISLDFKAVAWGTALILALIFTGYLLIIQKRRLVKYAIGIAGIISVVLSIQALRTHYRYQFYKAGFSYDVYYPATLSLFTSAAEFTDTLSEKVIAFSIAHEDISYRWFRYIFMGSHLQNQVIYIAPTANGDTWSQMTSNTKPQLSYSAWKNRLKDARVDYYYSMPPYPQEAKWAAKHSEDFAIRLISPSQKWILFKCK